MDGLQNTLKPIPITTFVTTDPVAGSGTATDLALGADPTGTDTISSPYVDYTRDYAYVGNDIGVLYRIKDVFCPSYNTDTGCTLGLGPSIDTSWGTGGAVTVGGGCGVLTGAVDDSVTGNVFVGCSDGRLYGYASTGAPLPPFPHSDRRRRRIRPSAGSWFPRSWTVQMDSCMQWPGRTAQPHRGTQIPIGKFSTTRRWKKEAALGRPPNIGENLSIPLSTPLTFRAPPSRIGRYSPAGMTQQAVLTLLYDVGFNSSRQR